MRSAGQFSPDTTEGTGMSRGRFYDRGLGPWLKPRRGCWRWALTAGLASRLTKTHQSGLEMRCHPPENAEETAWLSHGRTWDRTRDLSRVKQARRVSEGCVYPQTQGFRPVPQRPETRCGFQS